VNSSQVKDPYKTLGVSPEASAEEIKKAYRKLAHQYHPDRGGDEAKFKDISAAYEIVGNEEKRAQYDAFRAGPQIPPGFGGGAGGFDLGDLLSQMFGGGMSGAGGPRGNVEYRFYGGGSPFGGSPFPGAGGSSQGPFSGARSAPPPPRSEAATAERKVRAADGTTLTQRGSDVYSDVKIGFDQAVLGCVATVSTLSGAASVKIPPGTSSGAKLRLKGKGAIKPDGARGNHYVTVQIEVPKKIDAEAEKLLVQLMDRVKKS